MCHKKSRKLESNQRRPHYEGGALPSELLRHTSIFDFGLRILDFGINPKSKL